MDVNQLRPFWKADSYFRRIAGLALLLLLPSLWTGLQLDDYFHWALVTGASGVPAIDMPASPWDLFGFLDGDSDRARLLMDSGLIPWWAFPEVHYAFWRPLVEWTHAVDYLWFTRWPVIMHVHSLLWYLLVLWLAHRCFDLLLRADAARWATLIFALHYGHGLPAGWLANRNSLMATAAVLLTVLMHHRARGQFSGYTLIAFMAALLCGELGVSAGLMLLAYALFLDERPWRQKSISLGLYGGVGISWLVARKMLGYGAQGSGHYLDPTHDPSGFLATLWVRLADLLNGQFLPLPPEFATLIPVSGRILLACLLVVLLSAGCVRLLRHEKSARFFMLSMVLCLIPVTATLPHSRLLMCVSIGGAAIVGLWLAESRARRSAGLSGKPRAFIAGVVVVCACVLSPILKVFEGVSIRLAMDGMINRAAHALEWEEASTESLVLINPPLSSVTGYLSGIRQYAGKPSPPRTVALVSGRVPVDILVEDAHTLLLEMEAGVYEPLQENLLRGNAHALKVGDRVALPWAEFEIVSVNTDRIPDRVRVRFSLPLSDESLQFKLWNRGRLAECRWPTPGARLRLTMVSDTCSVNAETSS